MSVKNKIFVDTLFIVALINKRDQYHPQALKLAQQVENYPLIITDAVLLEVGNSLASKYRNEAINIIESFLQSDDVAIIHLSPELLNTAITLYKKYQDKQWGLVDCVSFVVMEENNINQALTFDKHFIQAGFQALMR
ncbi:MAG: type II toxin-antitoxin system VapC family toxin [Crocosphaera sp.]